MKNITKMYVTSILLLVSIHSNAASICSEALFSLKETIHSRNESHQTRQFVAASKLTALATSIPRTNHHTEIISGIMDNFSSMSNRLENAMAGLRQYNQSGWMYRMTHRSEKDLRTNEAVAASYGLLIVNTQLIEMAMLVKSEGTADLYTSLSKTIHRIDRILIEQKTLTWALENSLDTNKMQTYWATAVINHNRVRAQFDKIEISLSYK